MRKSYLVVPLVTLLLGLFLLPKIAYATTYTTVFSDNFTDADNTTLTAHDSNWIDNSGSDTIVSNQLHLNDNDVAYLRNFTSSGDQCLSFDLSFPPVGQIGIYSLYNPTSDIYVATSFYSNGVYRMEKNFGSGAQYVTDGSTSGVSSGVHTVKQCSTPGSSPRTVVYIDGQSLVSINDGLYSGLGTGGVKVTNTANIIDNIVLAVASPAPTPTPTPTLTTTPVPVTVSISPSSSSVTVGTPFTATVAINGGGQMFNAAQATVNVSSNLSVTNIQAPNSNGCNLQYTQTPTASNPSFAGAIVGSSSTGCTVYTLTLTPTAAGAGTITLTNASVKAYANASELLTGVGNGSYTVTPQSTTAPSGTTFTSLDDSVVGTGSEQWNYVSSGWSHCASCNDTATFYNTSVSWDNTTNDYVTLSFTGEQVRLYGFTDPRDGTAAVSIDGGAETNVDYYSPTRTGNVLLWTSPVLSLSTHTLRVRVTGVHNSSATDSYIGIDRAEIAVPTMGANFSLNSYPLDTYGSSLNLTGTKDATITHIFVNGSETGVTYPTSTTWAAPISLSSYGPETFALYGKDDSLNQTATQSISINKHILGDINGDGVVNLVDMSLFAVDWGKTSNLTYPLSDMNGDGNVDLTDFSILAKQETN